jgi:predicted transcriptional regulator
MYLLPQEVEVWYIIPAIRKEMAKIFTEKYSLSYEKAGDLLGISKAAVSQYLSNKRANKVKLNTETKKEVEKAAKIMLENKKMAVSEIQRVMKFMRENKSSCDVCKKYNKDVLDYCNHNPNY